MLPVIPIAGGVFVGAQLAKVDSPGKEPVVPDYAMVYLWNDGWSIGRVINEWAADEWFMDAGIAHEHGDTYLDTCAAYLLRDEYGDIKVGFTFPFARLHRRSTQSYPNWRRVDFSWRPHLSNPEIIGVLVAMRSGSRACLFRSFCQIRFGMQWRLPSVVSMLKTM
jgi:hypothetical protein